MLLRFFIDYPYIVYSIITLGFILIFIRWKGIKRLWPAVITGSIMIFTGTYWLIAVGIYKSNITLLPIFGVPLFLILWGALDGIVFAYYIREKTYQRILVVLIFAGLTVLFEYGVEAAKRVQHLGQFNNLHEYIFDVLILSTFVFLVTSLFEKRLNKNFTNEHR